MNWIKQHKLYIFSYLLFLISLAVPAVKTLAVFSDKEVIHHGLECMIVAYLQIPDFFNLNRETYLSFVALANTVFLLSPIIRLFAKIYLHNIFFIYMVLSTLLVLLTPFAVNTVFSGNLGFLMGFYIWSVAFILSCIDLFIQRRAVSIR